MTKLLLGSGNKTKPGYQSVDIKPPALTIWDLNNTPWPFAENEVTDIEAIHVLEHLGKGQPELRIKIMKELYRVCKDGAIIHVIVPNPFHSDFLDDPTHCWPVTANTFRLFDKEFNKMCVEKGMSNSTLGLDYDIDFRFLSAKSYPCIGDDMLAGLSKRVAYGHLVNSISQVEIKVRVVKK